MFPSIPSNIIDHVVYWSVRIRGLVVGVYYDGGGEDLHAYAAVAAAATSCVVAPASTRVVVDEPIAVVAQPSSFGNCVLQLEFRWSWPPSSS